MLANYYQNDKHSSQDCENLIFLLFIDKLLTLIGMRQGGFTSLIILGLDFVS